MRRGQYAADVDVDHAIHLCERRFLERFRNGGASIVHKHIKPAESRDRLFDRALDSLDVGGVRLDRLGLSAIAFNGFDHGGSCDDVLRVGDGHARPIRGQEFRDRCANAPRAAGDQGHFLG